MIRKFFREGIEKKWGSSVFGRRGYQDWQVRRGTGGHGGRIGVFCLTVDKACFCLHTEWYLHRYGEGVDGARNKRGGYPTLRVQHNSLKGWANN